MKKTITAACAALLLAVPLHAKDSVATTGAKPGVWTMDYDAAKKVAAEKDLPLFLNFTGSDWCGWCQLMDAQVFSKPKWETFAKQNIMLVWIDFPNNAKLVPQKFVARNQELQKKFDVSGYPTYIILNSDAETRIGRLGGSRDATPENFIEKLQAVIDARVKKETAQNAKPDAPQDENYTESKIATTGAEPGVWTMDYDAAKKTAAEKNLPILVNFTGSDWCGWCKLMDAQVFSKPDWDAYARQNIMLVWVDFPKNKKLVPQKFTARNQELQKRFGVEGYPSYVVLDSDGEARLGKLGASMDATPAKFIKQLGALLDKRPAKSKPAAEN